MAYRSFFFKSLLLAIVLISFYQCEQPRCNDGRLNGDEEAIDCGGSCGPCYTCNDDFKNRDETAVDCGGTFCDFCPHEWQPIERDYRLEVVDISVLDEQTIYAAANNKIIRSEDGGLSWEEIGPDLPEDYRYFKLKFFDNQNGYAVGRNFTAVTYSGGADWIVHQDKFSRVEVAAFGAPNRIFINDLFSMKVSTDDGASFQELSYPQSNQYVLL